MPPPPPTARRPSQRAREPITPPASGEDELDAAGLAPLVPLPAPRPLPPKPVPKRTAIQRAAAVAPPTHKVQVTRDMLAAGATPITAEGVVAKEGDWIVVEDAEVTYMRQAIRVLRHGGTRAEVFDMWGTQYKLSVGKMLSLWKRLGVVVRTELSDPAAVDALVAGVMERSAYRQRTLMSKMRSAPPSHDPRTTVQHDRTKLAAAKASRGEDEFLLGLLGTADQRWNKSHKVDVVGGTGDTEEEREVLRRLLGPNATIASDT